MDELKNHTKEMKRYHLYLHVYNRRVNIKNSLNIYNYSKRPHVLPGNQESTLVGYSSHYLNKTLQILV